MRELTNPFIFFLTIAIISAYSDTGETLQAINSVASLNVSIIDANCSILN
jgi:hypothetical protein